MCGIGGIFYSRKHKPNGDLYQILDAMGKRLAHRGPDSEEILILPSGGIFHRRLSIIDPKARANQPFVSHGGSAFVCNGEIYNYQDLRLNNYPYQSQSDSEVLFSLLLRDGIRSLDDINGMYAFAWWDQSTEELILARDPVGIKPLYYYQDEEKLIFASEIKSILAVPGLDREISDDSVGEFLEYGYVLGNNSGFMKIKQVPPGSFLKYRKGKIELKKYHEWFVKNFDGENSSVLSTYEAITGNAIQRRLVSDVPLTVFLSGGIDSSTISYFLKDKFNISFSTFALHGDKYSEVDKAKFVAEAFKLRLRRFSQREVNFKDLADIFYYADDLISDPALISNFLLYEAMGSNYRVGISGDGADELYLGYHAHYATFLTELTPLSSLSPFCTVLSHMVRGVRGKYPLSKKLKRYGKYSKYHFPLNHLLWRSPGLERFRLVGSERKKSDYLQRLSSGSLGSRMTLLDLQTYLPNNILKKVDRMSMAHSMEVRVPFLDKESVNFALSLADKDKITYLKQKVVMRQFLRSKISSQIYSQAKKGFGVDLDYTIRRKYFKSFLLDHQAVFHSYIDKKTVENEFDRIDNYEFFTLLSFRFWIEKIVRSNCHF